MPEPTPAEDFEQAVRAAHDALSSADQLALLGQASPELVRTGYGARLAGATRAMETLRAAAARREKELRQQLEDQLAELRLTMEPLTAMVKHLEEGIWTVNLYLGRDEQITQIADGDPAPAGTPITLRQLVLAMDEECLVAVEQGGVDARHVDDFAAWLTEDPRHLDQVMPDPKGVVVLVASRQRRNYGDTFVNGMMQDANKVSHWLIRNGDRVYLMVTDIEVGDRMLPTRAEFLDFFYRTDPFGRRDQDRVPLTPCGQEWLRAERDADARRRHYMRIMLVLQGLADRTTVFQPLPDPVNFLDLAAQDAGQVRIVNELDLVLTTGRESFRQWQRQLMDQLRPGMRIVGAFTGQAWRDVNDGYEEQRGWHVRLHPLSAWPPRSNVIHTIEDRTRTGGGLVLRYQRDDTVADYDRWGRYIGQRSPKNRASCTLYPGDDFVLPIDLVTLDELYTYLHARTERHQYLFMVPVIKAAIAAKLGEQQAEEPFMLLLAGRIAAAHDVDVADVLDEMPDLVAWWKLTNRHQRALVTADDPEMEGRALAAIEREWELRRRAEAGTVDTVDKARLEQLRELVPAAICIGRRRDGSYVAYEPANGFDIWLHETRVTKTGRPAGPRREWVQVSPKTRAALAVLWTDGRWSKWNHNAVGRRHLTDPELAVLVETMRANAARHGTPIVVVYRESAADVDSHLACRFEAYAWAN